uniref:Uncharacterized protein n=1 Tax=Setaria italica TaxID=4555 RepID=K3Z1S8_SETIT
MTLPFFLIKFDIELYLYSSIQSVKDWKYLYCTWKSISCLLFNYLDKLILQVH